MNSPSKKRKTSSRSDDDIIDKIISSASNQASLNALKNELHNVFLNKTTGLPTKQYKSLLQTAVLRLENMTPEERSKMNMTLMNWEEGGLRNGMTGIIAITPTDPFYPEYSKLLQAIFGNDHRFIHPNGTLDLANSTVALMISELGKGCQYGNSCRRQNPLHRTLMHAKPQINGGKRKTFKRNTRKSKKLKRRTYRK